MLYVNFNLDRIEAFTAKPPESRNAILQDHDRIVSTLRDSNLDSLSIKERLIIFSYLRQAVYARAGEQGHFIDQMYRHPFEGMISNRAICESLYNKEIEILGKISASIDYSEELKNKIVDITKDTFDEILTIEKFRNDFLFWNHMSMNDKISSAYGFLWVFSVQAKKHVPWPVEMTAFYLEDGERLRSTTMAAVSAPLDTADEGKHFIIGNPNVVDKLSPKEFFSSLHHEAIHDLLFQMMWAYKAGACYVDTYQADAELKRLSLKYNFAHTGEINSLYFSNCEELICYSNDFEASKRLSQLSPSMQISYCPASPI